MTPTKGQASSSAAYDAESPFYDYTWDRLTEDITFYQRRLGDVRAVLDAMCGTGRVSIALARAGIRVWGADSSTGMLKRARARLRAETPPVRRRVRLKRIDLVRGVAGKGLDAAIIAVNSYGLIRTPKDRVKALRNVRRSLRRGGKLILALDSVLSYRTIRDGVPFLTTARVVDGRGRIYIQIFAETGSRARLIRSETLHILLSRSARVLASQQSRTVTAVLSLAQVKRELRKAGFAPRSVFGDYDQRPYSPSGHRFIVEAVAA
ncbi:MAG: class I SAM-dependent methyltransferase [Thermoplasmata archaeon]